MVAWQPRSFADQLNIDTPEQVDLQFSVAGIGSRFVAILIDHLIQVAFYIVAILLFSFLLSGSLGDKLDMLSKWFLAAFIALNFCLIWGYFAFFEAFWHGQTPGKRAMKLRVIKDSGRQITFFEALSRNLLRFVDYLPTLYLVGVITMLCNKRHQRLGDLTAGTLVIHERVDEQPLLAGQGTSFFPRPERPAYDPVQPASLNAVNLPADAVAKLSPEDLVIIETFFARALDLSLEIRAQIAHRIAAQISTKMGITPPAGNPERLLEAIAYAMRGAGRLRSL
ncbi:MAG TPA: RDD family protein [Acidobacteriaceae bacterium]|jgi:uncharacterized RDD family membrane protein YckC|nr:RDD family protein [Acidobacteriaceae bacterium]